MSENETTPIITISVHRPVAAQSGTDAATAGSEPETKYVGSTILEAGITKIGSGRSERHYIQLLDRRLGDPHLQIELIKNNLEPLLTLLVDSDYVDVTLNGVKLLKGNPTKLEDQAILLIGFYKLTYFARTPKIEAPSVIPKPALQISQIPLTFSRPLAVEQLPPLDSRFSRHIVETETSRYLYDLPAIYHTTPSAFLGRYLRMFEAIWEPFEIRQDYIHMYFDPRSCPVPFLALLESWFGIDFSHTWPEERRRKLLSRIGSIYHVYGTKQALAEVLEIYTGYSPTITNANDPFVLQINLNLPPTLEVNNKIVEAVVQSFKPAHLGYRIVE